MDQISLSEYDVNWPHLFRAESVRIREALPGDFILRLEHIGSTAIQGLASKPVIDILLGVQSIDSARIVAIPRLQALGYAHWIENPNRDHLFFVKGLPPNGPRTHHVHIVPMDSRKWDAIVFRNYLRTHPVNAAEYVVLKQQLASEFEADREAYTAGKTEFVNKIVERARDEFRITSK